MAEGKARDLWETLDLGASIASKLLIPVVLLVVGHLLTSGLRAREAALKQSELERAWVQLALDVLKDDTLAQERQMRDWSVAVINHYVPDDIKIPTGLREQLVEGQVSFPGTPSPERLEIIELQKGLNALGICGSMPPDGLPGARTLACVREFLGGATPEEVRVMLSSGRQLLIGWVAAQALPQNWRELVPGLPAAGAAAAPQ